MFQNFFAQFNAYLLGHPAFLAKLKFLFWLKYWILTVLMAIFIYLIYKERGAAGSSPSRKPDAMHGYKSFEA
jgi:hypothetical protein